MRGERRRVGALDVPGPRGSSSRASLLGRVIDAGVMPAEVPGFFAVDVVEVSGDEAEGSALSVAETGREAVFLVLGPEVPDEGDILRGHLIGGYWVAQRGSGEIDPLADATSFIGVQIVTLASETGRPNLASKTIVPGVAETIRPTWLIRFSGTITGGTFRLAVNDGLGHSTGATTPISWSNDNVTLIENIRAGLQAAIDSNPLVLITGLDIDILPYPPDDLVAGNGYVRARADNNLNLGLFSSSLTGTAPAIEITNATTYQVGRNQIGRLYVNTASLGLTGTFRLAFDGQETGSITYSTVPGTLDANVIAAMEALPNVGPGNFLISGGVYNFTGALAKMPLPDVTVAENNLSALLLRRNPLPDRPVVLMHDGHEESRGVTDADGFALLPAYHIGTGFILFDEISGGGPGALTITSGGLTNGFSMTGFI